MSTLGTVGVVARLLAGPKPTPGWWRRAQEIAAEVVAEQASRHGHVVAPVTSLEVRRERRSCVGCGRPFQSGQAYVVAGPLHIGCRRP